MYQVKYDITVFLSKSLKFPKEWRNKDDIAKGESSKPKTRTPARNRDMVSMLQDTKLANHDKTQSMQNRIRETK